MYVIFFLMWVIFNGRWTLEIVLFGLVIAAVIYAFVCKFMDFSWKKDLKMCKCFFLVLQYIGALILEILKANVQTTKIVLARKQTNHPVLVKFQTELKSRTARVILANSITLTPGTITVSLVEDRYVVHCLDKSMAQGLADSIFVTLLKRMEEMK